MVRIGDCPRIAIILLDQREEEIDQFSADGAYIKISVVYKVVTVHSPDAVIVIPPRSGAVISEAMSLARNLNLAEIKQYGRMNW